MDMKKFWDKFTKKLKIVQMIQGDQTVVEWTADESEDDDEDEYFSFPGCAAPMPYDSNRTPNTNASVESERKSL